MTNVNSRLALLMAAPLALAVCGQPDPVLRGMPLEEPVAGVTGTDAGFAGQAGSVAPIAGAAGASSFDAGVQDAAVAGNGGAPGGMGPGGAAGARDAAAPDLAPMMTPPDLRPACTDGSLPTDEPLIDFEDGVGRILARGGRTGAAWHRFSSTASLPALSVGPTPSSACDSTKALRVTVAGQTNWSGINQDLSDRPMDLSAYGGITFWARSATNRTWMFLMPDAHSRPPLCDATAESVDCNDHAVATFAVGPAWKRITVRFAEMARRTSAAGAPRLDLTRVIAVEWQFGSGGDVDAFIDDVALVK